MILKFSALSIAVLTLAGCGTFASNADVPSGVYAGLEAPVVADTPSVKLVTGNLGKPVTNGVEVSGMSCKNKLWQPAPSSENAIAVMKQQAAKLGFHAVQLVSVHDDPDSISKNCWSALIADGVAFNPG